MSVLPPDQNINELWYSHDAQAWEQALHRYWRFVKPQNLVLEKTLDKLDIKRLHGLSPQGWYDFLRDEYFRWKYTAPNRYRTTTIQLEKYVDLGELHELEALRQQILSLDVRNVRAGLNTAKKIRGLGTAGASGLLSLIYPEHFATVDQFVVKALLRVTGLTESEALSQMKPQNLSVTNALILIGILSRKAQENNQKFSTMSWTPRKIDMVLWTYGR